MSDPVRDEQHLATEADASEGGPVDEAAEAELETSAPEQGTNAAEPGREGGATAGELRKELDALNDRHLRLAAEFNNYRRRTEQERQSAWARAQADLLEEFLDVLDDLSRVAHLDTSTATIEAIMEGIDLVERKFVRTLEEAGVEVIDPAGQPFDPERMEAMMRVQSEEQDDVVAQVMQKGYSLKGVLVRPARVAVYKQG